MARPRVDTVEVAVRIPKPLLKKLALEAMGRGTTPNQLIRDILVARDMGVAAAPPPDQPPAAEPEPPPDTAQELADEWL